MSDQLLIYLIVALNIACQLMLIWHQKLPAAIKWKFISLAAAIPLVIMVTMRILIANSMIHGHISEQSLIELYITRGTSLALIAGPWFVSFAAVIVKVKNRFALRKQVAQP